MQLANETEEPVSFHVDMLAYDPRHSQGVSAGFNPAQTVASGDVRTLTYFAHPQVGETVALVRDWGNVLENPGLGLYGAIIVGPQGTTYSNPVTGDDMSLKAGWRVDAHPSTGSSYRDFTLFIQDEDEVIGTHLMPYTEQVEGVVGLNYRVESLLNRLKEDPDRSEVFNSDVHGDPSTPLVEDVRRQNKWDKRGAFKACNLDANRLRQFSDLPTSVRLDSFASPPVSSPVWRLGVRGTYPPA